MRAPKATGNDVAVCAQKAAVGLDTGPQQFGACRTFTFHLRQQCVADILIERRRVGVARGRARHGDATAGAFMQTECVGRTGKLEIDEMETIRNHEPDRSRQLFGASCSRSRIRLRNCSPFIIEVLIATALGPIRYFWSRGR